MALIRPFRALRPARDAAPAVSSVPYDVVSTDEARQIASGNPLSFLHVTRSEIDLPPGADPYSSEVYAKARANLAALRTQAPLVQEDQPALYFYRLRMGGHEQTGVALYIVYPPTDHLPQRVAVFRDFLIESLTPPPWRV